MHHELVTFPDGSHSVRPVGGPEAMHSHIGAWEEARRIYVEPSHLAERLTSPGPPLVLLDLGLGIAANALAAIASFRAAHPRRDLRIFSFEAHLSGLRLALENQSRFDWLERDQHAVRSLLTQGQWSSSPSGAGPTVSWELREGDFMDPRLRAGLPAADFVFFDFYSPKTSPELWGLQTFELVRALCSPDARLMTYAASTSARTAMLLSGFFVGVGSATQAKSETTIASPSPAGLADPLGREWLAKLGRSHKPLPADCTHSRQEALDLIRSHPQFARSSAPIS